MPSQPMVRIDTTELRRLQVALREFDPKLLTKLRKRVKEVGQVAVDAVKKSVTEPTPGGDTNADSRQAVADATTLTLSFSKTSAGLKVTSSARRLDAEHKGFLGSYNKPRFRHPVFGSDRWVQQTGKPYFGAAITPVADKEMIYALRDALDEACISIGARGR